MKLLHLEVDPGQALYAIDLEGALWMAPLADGKPSVWILVESPDVYARNGLIPATWPVATSRKAPEETEA